MTATLDPTAHKSQRAALQARLKNRDEAEAAKNRAHEELLMAKKLVEKFERSPGYLTQFELAFSMAAKQFNSLSSEVPQQLANGCQDKQLKDAFANAMGLRRQWTKQLSQCRNGVQAAVENLAATQARISDQRGKPAILEPGESMPWDRSLISKVAAAVFDRAPEATWVISADGQTIAFSPGVHPENARRYIEDWDRDTKALQRAETLLAATAERLKSAEDELAECKCKLIWSPI